MSPLLWRNELITQHAFMIRFRRCLYTFPSAVYGYPGLFQRGGSSLGQTVAHLLRQSQLYNIQTVRFVFPFVITL